MAIITSFLPRRVDYSRKNTAHCTKKSRTQVRGWSADDINVVELSSHVALCHKRGWLSHKAEGSYILASLLHVTPRAMAIVITLIIIFIPPWPSPSADANPNRHITAKKITETDFNTMKDTKVRENSLLSCTVRIQSRACWFSKA